METRPRDPPRRGADPDRCGLKEPSRGARPSAAAEERPLDDLRNPSRPSFIAEERLAPGRPSPGFLLLAALAALGAGALLLWNIDTANEPLTREEVEARDGTDPYSSLVDGLPPGSSRALSAAGVMLAVGGTAFAGRRLFHSEPAALLACLLVGLDPGILALGNRATWHAPVVGLAMASLALFSSRPQPLHWLGAVAFTAAAALDPRTLLWSLPLTLLVLLRGHIYAAPVHLVTAAVQAFVLPGLAALGVLFYRVGQGQVEPACLVPGRLEALGLLRVQDLGGGAAVLHNPIVWARGIAALGVLGTLAISHVVAQFRLARLPGRIQLRLPAPLPRNQARVLWLLGLAVLSPTPFLWLPIFALALSAGLAELSRDAPGFGAMVGLVTAAIAVAFLARAWGVWSGAATGAEVEDLLGIIPWSRLEGC